MISNQKMMVDEQSDLWRDLSSDDREVSRSEQPVRYHGYEQLSHTSMPDIGNQDHFYQDLYRHYEKHGLVCMLTEQAMDIFVLAFTTLFSVFLFLFFDWSAIMRCESVDTCHDLNVYVNRTPDVHGFWGCLVVMYFVTLSLLWCWRIVSYSVRLPRLIAVHRFVRDTLQISDQDLSTLQWDEVIGRIRSLHRRDPSIMGLTGNVTAHDIASRIMRQDNYLIAMHQSNVLDIHFDQTGCLFGWLLRRCCSSTDGSRVCTNLLFTRYMEWNIRACLLNRMHDENHHLLIDSPADFRSAFRYMAVFNVIFMPFILLFMCVRFALENAERFYSSRTSMGHRNWSWLAHWTFREYCELPHVFYKRLNRSHKPAQQYLAQFRYTLGMIVARAICFVAGSFLAVLICFSLLDEHVPLYVEYADRNLLWYGAILTGVVTICRLMIPEEEYPTFAPEGPMEKIVKHTHYRLTQDCRRKNECDRFSALYPYKIVLLGQEMLSVVMAPMLLWCVYPAKVDAMLAFVRTNTVRSERTGDVVRDSCFMHRPRTTHKMQNSLVSFVSQHTQTEESAERATVRGAESPNADNGTNHPAVSNVTAVVNIEWNKHKPTHEEEDRGVS